VSDVHVEQVDSANEPLLRALWEIRRDAEAEPFRDLLPHWEMFRDVHARSNPEREVLLLGGFETVDGVGRLVGAAQLVMWLIDNTHVCNISVHVSPAERRRGIGSALLAGAERLAAAHGRTTLTAEVHIPEDGAEPGERFGLARGYAVALVEEIKVVDLVATEPTWPDLERHAAERLAPYELVSWTGAAPEEHLEDLSRLFGAFLDEAPTGDLDLRTQSYNPERIRQSERLLAESGRTNLVVTALAPDNTVAGYSNVTVSDSNPRLGYIGITLVMPDHRGHRLGLAMKVRLHQLVRDQQPECTRIVTGNADVNAWMNAVNEQLGYRVIGRGLELQKVNR
jgi:GNAT superfamily N-acetyltransferase